MRTEPNVIALNPGGYDTIVNPFFYSPLPEYPADFWSETQIPPNRVPITYLISISPDCAG